MKVYVVSGSQPDNRSAASVWSTLEAAQAECDRLNTEAPYERYAPDEYDLDPTPDG